MKEPWIINYKTLHWQGLLIIWIDIKIWDKSLISLVAYAQWCPIIDCDSLLEKPIHAKIHDFIIVSNCTHWSRAGQLLGIDEWGGGINSSSALHKSALLSPGKTLNTFQETQCFRVINSEYHCRLRKKGKKYCAPYHQHWMVILQTERRIVLKYFDKFPTYPRIVVI